MSETRPAGTDEPTGDGQAADTAAAELLWAALYRARAGESHQSIAELEDAAFRFYLPMARTLAHRVNGDTEADRIRVEQAAELGLSHSILAWRHRTGGGFRRFARSTIRRQLLLRGWRPSPAV
jgi:hypothetical protein